MHPRSTLGKAIVDLRERLTLSQKELAELVDVHSSHLSRIERGHCIEPGRELLRRIAGKLGLRYSQFEAFVESIEDQNQDFTYPPLADEQRRRDEELREKDRQLTTFLQLPSDEATKPR